MRSRSWQSRTPQAGVLLLLALATLPAPPRAAMSLAIVPPYIEKIVPSGSHLADAFSFTNSGDERVLVTIDFADFAVSESGEVTEQPPGSGDASLVPLIRVSPMRASVAPDQQIFFRYAVDVPVEFAQMRAMIYVSSHPESRPGANQVQVVARMGVPIYVENIKAEPADLRVESVEWDRPHGEPDRLRVRLTVANEGERNIRPGGYVHVTTSDRRFARTFEFNEGKEPVLPGQKRRWERTFGPVPEGDLVVKLRLATSTRRTFEADATVMASAR